jgi:hypothetical protein
MPITESQLNTLIEQRAEKKKKGGPRPNSGRPRKMTEEQLMEKLWPMSDLAFRVLEKKLGDGNEKALQIYFNYPEDREQDRRQSEPSPSGGDQAKCGSARGGDKLTLCHAFLFNIILVICHMLNSSNAFDKMSCGKGPYLMGGT